MTSQRTKARKFLRRKSKESRLDAQASWNGKRVLVMGLGLLGGGVGTARYFAQRQARVTVTDLRGRGDLRPSLEKLAGLPIRYVLGKHRVGDFRAADLVVRNPGVPDDSPFVAVARNAGIPVETEASLFALKLFSQKHPLVIGVTGTKGKTTSATCIAEGLLALKISAVLTGAPGTSFLETLGDIEASASRASRRNEEPAAVISELSSWDLESIASHRVSPHIAVVTNIFPDHLNRHGTMRAYAEAKSAIFRFQQPHDTLVIPASDPTLRSLAKSTPANVRAVSDAEIAALPPLRMLGSHQRMNAALACAAIKAALLHPQFPGDLRVPDFAPVENAIAAFRGVPGRLEVVGECEGRRFINDTTATNPGAACAAIASIDAPIILIAGGQDKQLPYEDFVNAIARRVKHVVLLKGSATEKVQRVFAERKLSSWSGPYRTMTDAVKEAWRKSDRGDAILLSPGAASFNMFRNEFNRGNQFVSAVRELSSAYEPE